jgi:hypothetical protein
MHQGLVAWLACLGLTPSVGTSLVHGTHLVAPSAAPVSLYLNPDAFFTENF